MFSLTLPVFERSKGNFADSTCQTKLDTIWLF